MNVGMLGYGTVGKALLKLLDKSDHKGGGIVVTKILRRQGKVTNETMTSDPQDILESDDIDTVVEVMGGLHPAYEYVSAALRNGKHVITANKALINAYGNELNALARKKKVGLLLSAACGGGIPIQPSILENKPLGIHGVSGILNGTTNYILDQMEREHLEFAVALKQAQHLGYAEADPSNDIDGIDTLNKIRLAIAVGLNTWVNIPTILCEGIRHISLLDTVEIQKLGCRCRLIAQGSKHGKSLQMSVEPTLVKANSAPANILVNYNLAMITPTRGNIVFLSGQGAGGTPTATNLLRDLIYLKAGQREMLPEEIVSKDANNTHLIGKYLIRIPNDQRLEHLKEWTEKEWDVEDHHYLMTRPVSAVKVHELMHAFRQQHPCFFARIDEEAL